MNCLIVHVKFVLENDCTFYCSINLVICMDLLLETVEIIKCFIRILINNHNFCDQNLFWFLFILLVLTREPWWKNVVNIEISFVSDYSNYVQT